MWRKPLGYFFAMVVVCIMACKKETIRVLDFDSITYTNALCEVIGEPAPGNWAKDSDWVQAEINLLAFNTIPGIADTALSKITVFPACPNPNAGQFDVFVKSTKKCKLKWVMVNRQLEILQYGQQLMDSGQFTISYDFRGITSFVGGNYRLYYGFYNAKDSLFYKGHGNIRWQ